MKNINVQSLKATERQFFKLWLMILQPFLKLRQQELKVLAELLYHRHSISKQVKNKAIINDLLFNSKTRKKIKQDLDIKTYSFNNILSSLRKKGVISENNELNKKIIPKVEESFSNFKLIYNIEIEDTKR